MVNRESRITMLRITTFIYTLYAQLVHILQNFMRTDSRLFSKNGRIFILVNEYKVLVNELKIFIGNTNLFTKRLKIIMSLFDVYIVYI